MNKLNLQQRYTRMTHLFSVLKSLSARIIHDMNVVGRYHIFHD